MALMRNETMAMTIATQKTIFAPSIAVPATPPNPKSAATIATTRKIIAQCMRLEKFIAYSLSMCGAFAVVFESWQRDVSSAVS